MIPTKRLTIEEFKKLPTHRKLAYFKKYRGMRYLGICSCCGERYGTEEELKMFEESKEYHNKLKEVLNQCENI